MNKFIKGAIIFAGGTAIGAGIGYVVGTKKAKKLNEAELDTLRTMLAQKNDEINKMKWVEPFGPYEGKPLPGYGETDAKEAIANKIVDLTMEGADQEAIADAIEESIKIMDAEKEQPNYSKLYKAGNKKITKSSIKEKEETSKAKDFIKRYSNTVQSVSDILDEIDEVEDTAEPEHRKELGPVYISPDDFGSIDEYYTQALYLTADGYVLDDRYELIGNPKKSLGADFLSHVGEYDDDALYVRNDDEEMYYDLYRDERSYSELTGKSEIN